MDLEWNVWGGCVSVSIFLPTTQGVLRVEPPVEVRRRTTAGNLMIIGDNKVGNLRVVGESSGDEVGRVRSHSLWREPVLPIASHSLWRDRVRVPS